MFTSEVFRSLKMPRWMRWYINYNLEDRSTRQQRLQLTLNLICLFAGPTTIPFVLYCLVHDLTLWPGAVVITVFGMGLLSLPYFRRWGKTALTAISTLLHCSCFGALTWLLGTGSGIYWYISITPVVVVATTGTEKPERIIFSAILSAASILFCVHFLSEPLLPAAARPPFYSVTYTFAVITPIIITLGAAFLSFSRAERAEDALEAAHALSEALLYNLLPEEIAARLKVEPDKIIADNLPVVAILFADIVNFTPLSAKMSPEEIVDFLNRIFSAFDELAEKHGLEKIKTIGDAYMVAAGMPNPCGDPVHRVAEMALDMLKVTAGLPDGVEVRIGLHVGPAVAGVIGNKKLFYDVWGETVNTASRMESHGEAGRIQVTEAVRAELEGGYEFELRGIIDVKGMGPVETWWLVERIRSG